MTVIVLVQESAINTRGHLQTQPSCPEGVGAAPLCWMPGLGQLGYELLGGLGGGDNLLGAGGGNGDGSCLAAPRGGDAARCRDAAGKTSGIFYGAAM